MASEKRLVLVWDPFCGCIRTYEDVPEETDTIMNAVEAKESSNDQEAH